MILNYLFLSSEPINSDITMKNQEFPEYTLFLRNFLSHISYPKEAEDGEQSNELKIPRTEFQITRHSCRNEAGQ